jgi:hypothetical protein
MHYAEVIICSGLGLVVILQENMQENSKNKKEAQPLLFIIFNKICNMVSDHHPIINCFCDL